MVTNYYEFVGGHIGDDFFDWWLSLGIENTTQNVTAFCDCFHKNCCTMNLDGQRLRFGDKIIFRDGIFELERGETEAFICPTHNIEHAGIGPYLCITTGEFT